MNIGQGNTYTTELSNFERKKQQINSNFERKKLYGTNQDSNILESNFSNRDIVRVPTKFKSEKQPQHLKR